MNALDSLSDKCDRQSIMCRCHVCRYLHWVVWLQNTLHFHFEIFKTSTTKNAMCTPNEYELWICSITKHTHTRERAYSIEMWFPLMQIYWHCKHAHMHISPSSHQSPVHSFRFVCFITLSYLSVVCIWFVFLEIHRIEIGSNVCERRIFVLNHFNRIRNREIYSVDNNPI